MSFLPEVTFPLTDPVLIFALLMATILIAPRLVERFKVPGIVGLILSGAIFGPSVFNLLSLSETATPGFMEVLGTAGLMYLMFQAGLSMDLAQFNTLRGRSLTFGLISFFIPQIATVLVAIHLLEFSYPAAFLLGSIIGSHTLVAYPIIARMGLMKNTAITTTLGGTLVTDTLSLSILAIVVASLDETSPGFWLTFAAMVSAFVFLALWGLPRMGQLFFRTVRNRPELEFGFLLTVLFATAWLAGAAGLAPIIGAFVAGLAMNRLVPEQGTLMARVRFFGSAFFIPFFLIYVGLLIDVKALFESVEVWYLSGILIVLVSSGKLIAAKLVQKLFGHTSDEGWTMYGLSVPQAAATLAVTLIGYEVGLFDSTLVNAVVVMILVTCIVGPAIVEKFGLKVAHAADAAPAERRKVVERILVPVANPKTSHDLLEMAFLMRDPDSNESIYPLMVVLDNDPSSPAVASGQKQLEHAVAMGAEANVPITPLTRIDMNISHGIARAASEERASMILIGWAAQVSTRQRIFGTVLDQLLEDTRQMVFVNSFRYPINTTQRVLLCIPPFAERSPGFYEAVHNVKLLASRVDAELEVICTEKHLDHDRKLVESVAPQFEARYVTVLDWSHLEDALQSEVRANTLIVTLSARPKTAPWFSELDEVPRMLATNYPEHSFSIVFLSVN